ncbi:AMP-binding protein [Actinocorallia sp. A-T 12471]|uniref:AMP-binding protein n=1 Tax=Actinocorallia sp. A-T 12471 TaxID=3089813 RepID=UPI0029CD1769|nr:AMP-binding protein [Actinocorallia sp. A-T 12471]MDX6738470.1 AMP-binding protein [Actinocorallia sp. A-T 12471]
MLSERVLTEPAAEPSCAGASATDGQLRTRHALNARPACPERTLHDVFFAHALRVPYAAAVRWGDAGILNYGELAVRALALAASLAERGVRAGDRVSVELPKGPDQAVAVLGVLALGAAYVPIGVHLPATRRRALRASLGVVFAVQPGTLTPGGPRRGGAGLSETQPDSLMRPVPVTPGDVAYVAFTAGRGGAPKPVEVAHRAAANTLDALVERYALDDTDVTFGASPLESDLSVFDMFAAWTVGGSVVLPEESASAAGHAALAERWAVTVLNGAPRVLDGLLAQRRPLHLLRVALLARAEPSRRLLATATARLPHCRLARLGGATETALYATVSEHLGGPDAVPYGVPLRGAACRVVDRFDRDVPDGVAGELWIGGACVAEGYAGDPVRTAAAFTVRDGVRWHRTGDLARYRPGGALEFLGRADAAALRTA